MPESIRKKRRQRGYAKCGECGREFKGRSQRKAEAAWREHHIEHHDLEPSYDVPEED